MKIFKLDLPNDKLAPKKLAIFTLTRPDAEKSLIERPQVILSFLSCDRNKEKNPYPHFVLGNLVRVNVQPF